VLNTATCFGHSGHHQAKTRDTKNVKLQFWSKLEKNTPYFLIQGQN